MSKVKYVVGVVSEGSFDVCNTRKQAEGVFEKYLKDGYEPGDICVFEGIQWSVKPSGFEWKKEE